MARERANMTAVELARRVGVSKAHISRIEHGAKFPSWHMIKKIAKVVNHEDLIYTFIVRGFPDLEDIFTDIKSRRARFAYDDTTIQQAFVDSIPDLFKNNKKDKEISLDILKSINFETQNEKLLSRLEDVIKKLRSLRKDLRGQLKKNPLYELKHGKSKSSMPIHTISS